MLKDHTSYDDSQVLFPILSELQDDRDLLQINILDPTRGTS